MKKLRVESLKVESFQTTSAAASSVADTDQLACWSPLCMETQAPRICPVEPIAG